MIMNGAADGLGSNVHGHHGEISKRLFPRRPCQLNLFTQLLMQAVSDVEKPFLFSDLAALAAKSENKNGFST